MNERRTNLFFLISGLVLHLGAIGSWGQAVAQDSGPAKPADQQQQQKELSTDPAVEDAIFEQILKIRERLGGGLSQHLDGITEGMDLEKAFGESLRQSIQQESAAPNQGSNNKSHKTPRFHPTQNLQHKPGQHGPGQPDHPQIGSPPSPKGRPAFVPRMIRPQIVRPVSGQRSVQNQPGRNLAVQHGAQQNGPHLGKPKPIHPNSAMNPSNQLSREQVERIREVVRNLDQLAAELEDIEAYSAADSTRELAQRLRLDARAGSGRKHHESHRKSTQPDPPANRGHERGSERHDWRPNDRQPNNRRPGDRRPDRKDRPTTRR